MTSLLLRKLNNFQLFNFNQINRDTWVREHAKTTAAGSKILDVGAGSCPYKDLFSHCHYFSHDFKKLKSGQLYKKSNYGNINYISDICSLPIQNESFDFVLCTEVLEHVPYPIQAVNELARVLKPNGKLLLSAPLGSGLHQTPYHYYGGFTPFWYTKILKPNFIRINILKNGGFFSLYSQETLRFIKILLHVKGPKKYILSPLILGAGLWFLFFGALSNLLDALKIEDQFTAGYNVSAIKKRKQCHK